MYHGESSTGDGAYGQESLLVRSPVGSRALRGTRTECREDHKVEDAAVEARALIHVVGLREQLLEPGIELRTLAQGAALPRRRVRPPVSILLAASKSKQSKQGAKMSAAMAIEIGRAHV